MRISILLVSAVLVVAFVSCKEQLSLNNEKIEEYMDSTENSIDTTDSFKECKKHRNLHQRLTLQAKLLQCSSFFLKIIHCILEYQ